MLRTEWLVVLESRRKEVERQLQGEIPPLHTSEEAAAILGVSPRLIRELWARRELGGVKVAGDRSNVLEQITGGWGSPGQRRAVGS
jgi:hypothetical protein